MVSTFHRLNNIGKMFPESVKTIWNHLYRKRTPSCGLFSVAESVLNIYLEPLSNILHNFTNVVDFFTAKQVLDPSCTIFILSLFGNIWLSDLIDKFMIDFQRTLFNLKMYGEEVRAHFQSVMKLLEPEPSGKFNVDTFQPEFVLIVWWLIEETE
ncbi:hypothetical protein FGIG_00561 [Fasciola gigantica]|uniref:Uncharacterized protein n=1 Tax=Fasciola gigantica TaxID=46835 RepID=A0A504YPJ6_FASGI|nr:hypothetical protein FGIG_00561 [Fasciola gigantica]